MCLDADVTPESIRRVTRAVLWGGALAVDGERALTTAARESDEHGEALVTITEVRAVAASVGRGTARRASEMVWSFVRAMHTSGERIFGREHPHLVPPAPPP